jgi:hypothetical protein
MVSGGEWKEKSNKEGRGHSVRESGVKEMQDCESDLEIAIGEEAIPRASLLTSLETN